MSWVVGFIVAMFLVVVYIEYVTYFPRRSGGEVVFLEQAYPKPRFMIPVTYAAVNVILSFSVSLASALSTYVFKAANYSPSNWELRGMSVLPLVLCAGIAALNTKISIRLSSFLETSWSSSCSSLPSLVLLSWLAEPEWATTLRSSTTPGREHY